MPESMELLIIEGSQPAGIPRKVLDVLRGIENNIPAATTDAARQAALVEILIQSGLSDEDAKQDVADATAVEILPLLRQASELEDRIDLLKRRIRGLFAMLGRTPLSPKTPQAVNIIEQMEVKIFPDILRQSLTREQRRKIFHRRSIDVIDLAALNELIGHPRVKLAIKDSVRVSYSYNVGAGKQQPLAKVGRKE